MTENYLGKNIATLRKICKISRYQMSIDLGIADMTLKKIESGEHTPNVDIIVRIASYFRVSLDELVNKDIEYIEYSEPQRKKIYIMSLLSTLNKKQFEIIYNSIHNIISFIDRKPNKSN